VEDELTKCSCDLLEAHILSITLTSFKQNLLQVLELVGHFAAANDKMADI
jgi:hypothetical protein